MVLKNCWVLIDNCWHKYWHETSNSFCSCGNENCHLTMLADTSDKYLPFCTWINHRLAAVTKTNYLHFESYWVKNLTRRQKNSAKGFQGESNFQFVQTIYQFLIYQASIQNSFIIGSDRHLPPVYTSFYITSCLPYCNYKFRPDTKLEFRQSKIQFMAANAFSGTFSWSYF